MMDIHPTALIHASAKIGKDVSIGPFAVIGEDTEIGDRCRIVSHSNIEYTTLGEECVVFPFTSLGFPPQHIQYKGEKTKLIVGNRCIFREGVTVHRGTIFDKGFTKIGNDGFFMNHSHVAHDCQIGNNVIIANGTPLAGHVEVGDRVFISALTGIHQRVRIGSGALVSGGAMVGMDVAPFSIVQGDRAVLRGLNIIGMRRAKIKRESIQRVKNAFKTVFFSGLKIKDALNHPDLLIEDDNVSILRDFLSLENRGITRPASGLKENVHEESVV